MPYAVWLGLTDPSEEPAHSTVLETLPATIMDAIDQGWEVNAFLPEPDVFEIESGNEDNPPEIVDVDLTVYPGGVFIGLALDANTLEKAIAVAVSLGRHLSNSVPAMLGWRFEQTHAKYVASSDDLQRELRHEVKTDEPRFPISEYLPTELEELSAQTLLASAVLGLFDPARQRSRPFDTNDIVIGAVHQDTWGRDMMEQLGGLLLGAARTEASTSSAGSVIGRGGGDDDVTQALVDAVREELTHPESDHDDDMRGYELIEKFTERHELRWNRFKDDETDDEYHERHRRQLELLLRAGIRALATFTQDLVLPTMTPWQWLALLDTDVVPSTAREFAEVDDINAEEAACRADIELTEGASAHVLIRTALMHPEHLNDRHFANVSCAVTGGPLHFLAAHALWDLAPQVHEILLGGKEKYPLDVLDVAATAAPALALVKDGDADWVDEMYTALAEIAPADGDEPDRSPALLRLISLAASLDPTQARKTAQELLLAPAEVVCVLEDGVTELDMRCHILAAAATMSIDMASAVASDFPELKGRDPRDEPALRAKVERWEANLAQLIQHGEAQQFPLACPAAGDMELQYLAKAPHAVHPLADADITTLFTAFAQALAAVCNGDDVDFVLELLRA